MKLRQAVIPAGASERAKEIARELQELGLDILTLSNPAFSLPSDWSGSLLIYDESVISSSNGRLLIRSAIHGGGAVLESEDKEMLRAIRRDLNLADDVKRLASAAALYRCIAFDASELSSLQSDMYWPRYSVSLFEKVQDLRYGENWHQRAALYAKPGGLGLYRAVKLNGKEMSYNNFVDAETVLEMLIDLSEYDGVPTNRPLAVIVKHANPCGVAYGRDLEEAYRWAFATDPKSAFGGVIGFNMKVDLATAEAIGDSFVEVLIAPGYEPEALDLLRRNKPNRRILDIGDMLQRKEELYKGHAFRSVFGGMMLQDYDRGDILEWRVVTQRSPTPEENRALRFAWKVTKYVKSNALVYTTADRTIGIGSGQVSRVDSARFGAEKAEEHGLDTRGTVAATDSFFPFRDGLDRVHEAGVTAVVHPGGSIRDREVIQAADEHGMAMVFTGMRHFRH
ncbi:MAG: phosphoribosylaminoimidazolecarboxamide formyltransferase [Methanothrix sp.]